MLYPDNGRLVSILRDFLIEGLLFAVVQSADMSFTYNRLLVRGSDVGLKRKLRWVPTKGGPRSLTNPRPLTLCP